MASSSEKSAGKANLSSKRKLEGDLKTQPILKRHREISEEKETRKEFADDDLQQIKGKQKGDLKRHTEISEEKETTKEYTDDLQQIKGKVELLERKSDETNLTSVKEIVEGHDEIPDFDEEAAVPTKKTLFIGHVSPKTEISDIIGFFKDVGKVVRVRFFIKHRTRHRGFGFVEFASSDEAKKALEKKNGECLHNRKIFLDVVKTVPYRSMSKHCIDHKVWYEEDYLPIEEDGTPNSAVLFVANLSPHTIKISHIINFFKDVGKVVSVRLIVNDEGKHVGYGFVEFASADEAQWALENMNGEYLHDHKILLMKVLGKTPCSVEEEAAVREKTLYVANLCRDTQISHIISFFKDIGEVVHVRLMVNKMVKHAGCGFVEFASSNEAKKALEKKNGEYLHNSKIFLDVVGTNQYPPYPPLPMYCIDHKVWYKDYLQRENVHDSPDLVEEVATREKTLFFCNVSINDNAFRKLLYIKNIFQDVGKVVRIRFIVNDKGEHVGCGFVEFAFADQAKKKSGSRIFLKFAEIAPYPFRFKHNLAEKLWYEDKLRREGLGLVNRPKLEEIYCGEMIIFDDDGNPLP